MNEPTAAEVRAIISLPLTVVDATIDAMVDAAVLLASNCAGVVSATPELQKEILRWIAAHLLSTFARSGAVTQQSLGDASESYASGSLVLGEGLRGSWYGQQAILLDPTGCLRRLGNVKPQLKVL